MRNFQDRNRGKSFLESTPVLVVLAIVLVFFAWGVVRFFIKMRETGRNREIAELKIAELEKTRQKLSVDIENLKTEKGMEESIREKFGLAKEGEGLIVVVDDKNDPNAQTKEEGNWFTLFLKNWFRR